MADAMFGQQVVTMCLLVPWDPFPLVFGIDGSASVDPRSHHHKQACGGCDKGGVEDENAEWRLRSRRPPHGALADGMTEIEAAAPLDGWCVSSSNRLPVASYHVAHLSDALPKIRRGTEAGSPKRRADETLEPNLRWWEKAAEEKSSVMEARIMCLGSGRNRC